MIQGLVNAAYEAIIPLTVQGPTGRTRNIEAVIDTGFTEFPNLPSGMVEELELPFVSASQVTLADGSEATLDVYRAAVFWDGELKFIRVYGVDAIPLVGMRLLDRHDLSIQVRAGDRVVVQAGA